MDIADILCKKTDPWKYPVVTYVAQ